VGTKTITNAVWLETVSWRLTKIHDLRKFAACEENWFTISKGIIKWQNAKLVTATASEHQNCS